MKKLLIDFNTNDYINTNIERLNEIIDRLNIEAGEKRLMGEFFDLNQIEQNLTSNVSLENVSHSIDNLSIENNCVFGNIKFLKTPMGKIAEDRFEESKMSARLHVLANKIILLDIFTWDIVIPKKENIY